MRFARHQLWLAADIGGGVRRTAVHNQVARTTGKKQPEAAAAPDLPGCLAHVWDWFCTLVQGQAGGGIPGPAALAADIEASFGLRPTASEMRCLLALFALWRRQDTDRI